MCFSFSLIKILMRTWSELSLNLFSFQNLTNLILWSSWDQHCGLWQHEYFIIIPPVCGKHHEHPSFPHSPAASREPQPLARSVIAVSVDSSRPAKAHPAGEAQPWWVLTFFPSVSLLLVSLASKLFLSDIIGGLELSHRRFHRTEKINSFSTAMCVCVCWHLENNWSNSPEVN